MLLLDPGLYVYEATKKKELNMIEIFVAVYLDTFSSSLRDTVISYETAVDMMVGIVELISCSPASADLKKGMATLFSKEKKDITCEFFYSTFRDNFEHGRHALRDAFKAQFFGQKPLLPTFNPEQASILDRNILGLVRMATSKMKLGTEMPCLYNSLKGGSSFNRLAFGLVAYPAPSLLLIRHTYKTTEGQSYKGLIGAIVTTEWKDELGYWGDSHVTLFTLLPKVRFLYSYKGKGGSNYVYLNTKKISMSKYQVGLGFGGQDYKNFRLWLDDEILDKSSTHYEDETFPMWALSDGYEERLRVVFADQIDSIEAWGFGTEDALESQKAYRDMKHTMAHNSRKIDKKKLIEGEFANQALQKNFGHRNQIDGDIEQMKEEAKLKP